MGKETPIVVCEYEGGYYKPYEGNHAPIRFYADGRVEDDVFRSATGVSGVRENLPPERLKEVIAQAIENKRTGYKGRGDIGNG